MGTCTAEGISTTGGRGYAALQDSIAPVAVRARLRYASAEIAQDTLVLNLSEAWVGDEPTRIADALAWVGSRSNVRDLLPVRSWVLTDPTTLRLVIGSDVSGSIHTGDSARPAWLATGSAISDVWGNRVGALLYGVEVEQMVPARASRQHVLHLLHAMQRIRPDDATEKRASKASTDSAGTRTTTETRRGRRGRPARVLAPSSPRGRAPRT